MSKNDLKTWWQGTYLVAHREVRDQLRDWRIVVPIVGLTLFFPFLMNWTAQAVVHLVTKYGADIVAERLFPFLMMIVGFFPSSISLVVALESFAGERERRTVEPLLVAPLTNGQLYVGKLIAVLFLPLSVSFVGVLIYVVGLHFATGWWPSLLLLTMVLLLTTVQAVLMVSAAVVISTQATSVRAANLLASTVIIPVALLLQGESLLMFWQHYGALWAIAGIIVLLSIFTSRIGLAHFNRENLLGREVDVLNVRWMGRVFWRGFRGSARSLKEWLALVGQDLRALRWPFVLALMLMVASGVLGVWLSHRFIGDTSPRALAASMRFDFSTATPFGISLNTWKGAMGLWWHNIRAMLLAAIGAGISFGVIGVLIPLLPYAIIGGALEIFAKAGVFSPWKAFLFLILPHGIVEIPATALFIAATLQLGASLASPAPDETLGDFWLRAWARWWRVFLAVVVPLMGLAAILEAFVTPRLAIRFLLQ